MDATTIVISRGHATSLIFVTALRVGKEVIVIFDLVQKGPKSLMLHMQSILLILLLFVQEKVDVIMKQGFVNVIGGFPVLIVREWIALMGALEMVNV